jgi:hypothetical protein
MHIALVSAKMGCFVWIVSYAVLLTQCYLRLQVKGVGAPYVRTVHSCTLGNCSLRIVPVGVLCTLASEMSGCSLRTVLYRVHLTLVSLRILGFRAFFFYEWVLLRYWIFHIQSVPYAVVLRLHLKSVLLRLHLNCVGAPYVLLFST